MQKAYSEFRYLYRDASNYKVYGSLILRDSVIDRDLRMIMAKLESGSFFIAEQVAIPPLYAPLIKMSGRVTRDDHAWHTFEGIGRIKLGSPAIVWGAVEDLVQRFASVRSWDVSQSAIYS